MKYLVVLLLTVGIGFSCKKDSNYKVNKNHKQGVGDSSKDLLSDDDYDKLIVEIQYMEGFSPTAATINNLRSFLNATVNKNDIEIKQKLISAQGKSSYSLDDIKDIEDDNREEFTSGDEIATYLLLLDGEYAGNSGGGKVLGVAYYNTSMALFQKSIKDLTGGLGQPSQDKLETTVTNHEFGHILGLVNNGSDMEVDHQDEANGSHCDNEDCLMNWIAETGDAVNNLLGNSPIPQLDLNCRKDLNANGGK